jgi:hypothetical protein
MKMKIFMLLSIFFAPLAVVLGQTSPLQQQQLCGSVTLGGIGSIKTEQDSYNFESQLPRELHHPPFSI